MYILESVLFKHFTPFLITNLNYYDYIFAHKSFKID